MGGLSLRGALHLLPWIAKLIILEPFRLVEVIFFERKINNHIITQSPIFILGHYRSGTTYLQRLFSFDSRFGHMSVIQQVAPELMLLYEKPLTKIMQWVSNLFKAQNHFHRVQHDWSYPGEEDIALMSLLSKYSATWALMFPKKFKNHFNQSIHLNDSFEKDKWRQDYTYLLNKISLKNRQKQLVLKSPPNTGRINKLKELFPDAKFVFISRNPYELFASMKRLWLVTINYHSLGSTKGIDIDELIFEGFEILLKAYLEQKVSLSQGELIEIDYQELVAYPVSAMSKIYSQLRLPEFELCKAPIERFAKIQKSYERLNHTLPEELMQRIKTKWEIYIKEYEKIKNKV